MNTTPPTTAQEALDLAWELAHRVKEGQTMPSDTQYLLRHGLGYNLRVSLVALSIDGTDAESIRTLDPLPEPEPDWLTAPAVLAESLECSNRSVWTPEAGTDRQTWECSCCNTSDAWNSLRDVTPLYPKEDA